jgi:hypothetical protein
VKKIFISILAFSFTLWIMPLGIFIKPSQQKLACDGQRAICMCHAFIPKADISIDSGVMLKAGSPTNNASSSAGNYFVSTKPLLVLQARTGFLFESPHFCYKSPFIISLEHVPKI